MSELKKQWTPEVGVPCLYEGEEVEVTGSGRYGWLICGKGGGHSGESYFSNQYLYRFSPIKSEAEKQRDKQIDLIQKLVVSRSYGVLSLGGVASRRIATGLHMEGCRMTRELTPEVIELLACARFSNTGVTIPDVRDFARAIEAYVRGEK